MLILPIVKVNENFKITLFKKRIKCQLRQLDRLHKPSDEQVTDAAVFVLVSAFHPLSLEISLSWDFPGCPMVKNLPSNAGDLGSTLFQSGN